MYYTKCRNKEHTPFATRHPGKTSRVIQSLHNRFHRLRFPYPQACSVSDRYCAPRKHLFRFLEALLRSHHRGIGKETPRRWSEAGFSPWASSPSPSPLSLSLSSFSVSFITRIAPWFRPRTTTPTRSPSPEGNRTP